MIKQKNIHILTFQWSNNYGAIMQAYALKAYIESLGHKVSIIDYSPNYPKRNKTILNIFKDSLLKVLLLPDAYRLKQQREKTKNFKETYFNLSKPLFLLEDFSSFESDCIICGSDQIWNPNLTGNAFDPVYFALFDNPCIKAAYGASIGENKLSDHYVTELNHLLSNFDYISVREDSIRTLVEQHATVPVSTVLDPTLLLSKSHYESLINQPPHKKPYLLVYQNTKNDDLYKTASYISKKFDLDIIELVYRRPFSFKGITIVDNAGPEDFISLFFNSSFVVTNTFHGTVFSVLGEKNFISFPLVGRESRVECLAEKLHLKNRLIYSYNEESINSILGQPINYDRVSKDLKKASLDSKDFILKVVGQ